MPSLKSLKLRIKSIKSTKKITKAMQMVSAAKLKRAKDQAESARAYCEHMEDLVKTLVKGIEPNMNDENLKLLFGNGKTGKTLYVCISSDRGLCGSFNQSVVKMMRRQLDADAKEGRTSKILCIGKKCYDLLKGKMSDSIIHHEPNNVQLDALYAHSAELAQNIVNRFNKDEFDSCVLVYNKFVSVVSQVTTKAQIIPYDIENDETCQTSSSLEFEPEEEEIVSKLLPKNLALQIFKSLLDSRAGEFAARMTAMDNATRNSGEIIDKLSLVYNRTRQSHITKELIEIISGAEAV